MFSVFISFVFGDDTDQDVRIVFGGRSALDAFVIRLVLVPSLMTVLGSANGTCRSGSRRSCPRFTSKLRKKQRKSPTSRPMMSQRRRRSQPPDNYQVVVFVQA
jgi:uncharacterized membrane protein YdfJ with MMPL/SSD domain